MSFYDGTIDQQSFQAGQGGTGTLAWEDLDQIINRPCYKGVWIQNNRLAGGNDLGVSVGAYDGDEATNMIIVPGSKKIFLPLKDPTVIRVAGVGGGVDYSYVAY
jgi:hypothetical protein